MTTSGTSEHVSHDHHPIEEELLELAGDEEQLGTLAQEARTLTKEHLAEGQDRDELIGAFKSVIGTLYGEDLDDAAEELLEVMAELEGFCSPHARL
jgi:hypothetical protein